MNILKKSTSKETPQARKIELRALILTAGVLLFGLFSVYQVKTLRPLVFSELVAKTSREETDENGKKIKKIPEIFYLREIWKKEK